MEPLLTNQSHIEHTRRPTVPGHHSVRNKLPTTKDTKAPYSLAVITAREYGRYFDARDDGPRSMLVCIRSLNQTS